MITSNVSIRGGDDDDDGVDVEVQLSPTKETISIDESKKKAVPNTKPSLRSKKQMFRFMFGSVVLVILLVSLGLALDAVLSRKNKGGEVPTAASTDGEEAVAKDEPSSGDSTSLTLTIKQSSADIQTSSPIPSPSKVPTPKPSFSPSFSPTNEPSYNPSTPSPTPFLPIQYGQELYYGIDNYYDLGIQISAGLSAKLIAKTGQRVRYSNWLGESRIKFHGMMDGAGIVSLPDDEGYVYVSNSEEEDGDGG